MCNICNIYDISTGNDIYDNFLKIVHMIYEYLSQVQNFI
jgi:hypothetical protein